MSQLNCTIKYRNSNANSSKILKYVVYKLHYRISNSNTQLLEKSYKNLSFLYCTKFSIFGVNHKCIFFVQRNTRLCVSAIH